MIFKINLKCVIFALLIGGMHTYSIASGDLDFDNPAHNAQKAEINRLLEKRKTDAISIENKTPHSVQIEVSSCLPYRLETGVEIKILPEGYYPVIGIDQNGLFMRGEKRELTIFSDEGIIRNDIVKTFTIKSGEKNKIEAFDARLPKGPDESEEEYQARIAIKKVLTNNTLTYVSGVNAISERSVFVNVEKVGAAGIGLVIDNEFRPSFPLFDRYSFDKQFDVYREAGNNCEPLLTKIQTLYNANFEKVRSGKSYIPLIMHTFLDANDPKRSQKIDLLRQTMAICTPDEWQYVVWTTDSINIDGVTVRNAYDLIPSIDFSDPLSVFSAKLLALQIDGGFVRGDDVVPCHNLDYFSAFDFFTSFENSDRILAAVHGHPTIRNALELLQSGAVDPRTSYLKTQADKVIAQSILTSDSTGTDIVLPRIFVKDFTGKYDPNGLDVMMFRYELLN